MLLAISLYSCRIKFKSDMTSHYLLTEFSIGVWLGIGLRMLPYLDTKVIPTDKTSYEKFSLILSSRGWLLQYTFSLSTLLVHLRNEKPLENQSIIKGLECPEQRHEYYLILPEKFHGDTMRIAMLYICISVYCVDVIAMSNLSSKILIEYNESHFADILQTKNLVDSWICINFSLRK